MNYQELTLSEKRHILSFFSAFGKKLKSLSNLIVNHLIHRSLGHVARNREANPNAAAGRAADRGVDANNVAVEVRQRATAIAGVDRSIGLIDFKIMR